MPPYSALARSPHCLEPGSLGASHDMTHTPDKVAAPVSRRLGREELLEGFGACAHHGLTSGRANAKRQPLGVIVK